MHKESNVLQWLLELKKTPTDLIEEVDRRTLRMLLDEMVRTSLLHVFFCS